MTSREKTATVDLRVRMKEPLRAQIEEAAKERGISLNAEAVARLEQSFRDQRLMYEALALRYGNELAGLLLVAGDAMLATALHKPYATQDFTPAWLYRQMVK